MYIDTHCHLSFNEFDVDRAMVIGNAKKAGVKQFIVPGVDVLSSQLSLQLADTYKKVIFSSVGFHPYEAQETPDIQLIETLINNNVVAIGECGLDYHLYKDEAATSKKTNQIRLFDEHCKLALKHDLPLIMHCRDAFDDFFSVLDSQNSMPKGVIHCFSGGPQEIRLASLRNLYLGIDGNITFSKQLQFVSTMIPMSMILLETDSPYLTPIPHRGTRNEPKYIPLIAKTIATQQQVTIESVALETTENAKALFAIQ